MTPLYDIENVRSSKGSNYYLTFYSVCPKELVVFSVNYFSLKNTYAFRSSQTMGLNLLNLPGRAE